MLSEEQGIKAIIALQAVGGVKEPEEKAKSAWNSFGEQEKIATESAHKVMCGGFSKEKS
jgi:hypothetical protein